MEEKFQSASLNNIQPLSKTQKISVAILGVFAIFVFVFWGAQFKKNLSGAYDYSNQPIASDNNSAGTINFDDSEALSDQDTDGDGLSDYDELNLYNTSPYLTDSDSDGYSDKDEIASKNNPNCPAGQVCYGGNVANGDAAIINSAEDRQGLPSANAGLGQNDNGSTVIPSVPGSIDPNQNPEKFLSGQVDAASLRKAMLGAGIDSSILNKVSDEELLNAYQGAVVSNKATTGQLVNPDAKTIPTGVNPQQVLNGQADVTTLRKIILEAGGMDPELLSQISDEDLLAAYKAEVGKKQ